MRTVEPREYVRLKPERAEAYGFDPSTIYLVVRVYTLNGYKTEWAELDDDGTLVGQVKVSELVRVEVTR